MRWPWQPPPGMVRISHKKLIPLLQDALRARELEAESAAIEAETRRLHAQARANELLTGYESHDVHQVARQVVEQLPMTDDGDLHEAAFRALLESQVWVKREEVIATWR